MLAWRRVAWGGFINGEVKEAKVKRIKWLKRAIAKAEIQIFNWQKEQCVLQSEVMPTEYDEYGNRKADYLYANWSTN